MCDRKIYLKNMVCDRCIMVVRDLLSSLDAGPVSVKMGVLEFEDCPGAALKKTIKQSVESLGFEVVEGRKKRMVESIKKAIIEFINEIHNKGHINISEYLSRKLNYDYGYLSNEFSSAEGISIAQYLINLKVEKVKELLLMDQLSLTEISYMMGYSSLPHLSAQFKKVTGQTPSNYRKQKDVGNRKSLDNVGFI